jgi:ribosomal-protein-alanine N-acetyltransferase
VPYLVEPARPAGSLRLLDQPRVVLDERLVLRPWRDDDVPAVRGAFAVPDIQRWHLRRLDSDDETRAWIAGWAEHWTDETDASWAIAGTQDDQAVGQVGLRTIVLAEAQAQLSYWVLPAARGTGAAPRAVAALTGWAFETLGLQRLYLVHSTLNQPSCRVAGKAGFPLEGTLRGHLRHADGWHDVHLHARLRTDPAARP